MDDLTAAVYLNGATIMTTPTDRQVQIARQAGYDGVEVRTERLLDEPAELEAAARDVRAGEVWSLNGVPISLRPDGGLDRDRLEADLVPRLAICAALGATYLLAVPPRAPGVAADEAVASVHDGLMLARDRAATDGIRIAFEFLGFFDCPIRTPALAAAAVDGIDRLDLVLDSCHWHASGAGSLNAYPVDRLAMVHLNDAPPKEPSRVEDADRVLPGDGVIELRRLVEELRRRGYRGPWSLETFNPSYWEADPREVAVRGRRALDSVLSGGTWHDERQSGIQTPAAS